MRPAIIIASLALLQAASAHAQEGRKLAAGFYQLTGTHLKVGQTQHRLAELPDPAPPYVNPRGEIEIYGSADYFIRYRSWSEFSRGGRYEIVPLDVRYPNGRPFREIYTHPWDLRKVRIEMPSGRKQEMLLGGSMSPTGGKPAAVWPDDNINRRVFLFRENSAGQWIRDASPLFGSVTSGWLGHSYGGNFFQASVPSPSAIRPGNGDPVYLFYERVSEEKNGPYRTEIFAREINGLNGNRPPGKEIKILSVTDSSGTPFPSTGRTIGGYLVEGPRPIRMRIDGNDFFIIGFSSGDFPTDSYTINYAWSKLPLGPYRPMLVATAGGGMDLLDLGRLIKMKHGLSWVGRPSFYRTPSGKYEMLFHGVFKNVLPDNDYTRWPVKYELWKFFRCLFKVELDVKTVRGEPILTPSLSADND
jgi:hypothetical protein